MPKLRKKVALNNRLDIIASTLIGFIVFSILFGFSTLIPTNVDWIFIRGGDALQHQLGWMAYRLEPWTWKLGEINNLLYPYGTSIVYTDSIPLFAVIFKLIRGFLPTQFQYLGWWTLLCWILNIHLAYLIFRSLYFDKPYAYLSSILLAISPLLVDRAFHHDALTAHWLIFASILLLINQIQGKRLNNAWIFLVVISFWIHAYLFVMVLLFYLSALVYEIILNHRYKPIIQSFIIISFMCIISAFSLGIFDSPADIRSKNLAHYSANMNALINPLNSSSYLKGLPLAFEGQYEGYAYLGIGVIFLLFVSIIFSLRNTIKPIIFSCLPILLPAVIMAAFSCGGSLTANDVVLYKLSIPEAINKIFLIFRSNGRFIWSAYYLIVIFTLYLASKHRFTQWLVIGVIAFQFLEIQPLLNQKDYIHRQNYQSPLSSRFWFAAKEHYQHIFILPEDDIRYVYMPFGIYAIQNNMTINWMYVARMDSRTLSKYYDEVRREVIIGNLKADTIYITTNPHNVKAIQKKAQNAVAICKENDYTIILAKSGMEQEVKESLSTCTP